MKVNTTIVIEMRTTCISYPNAWFSSSRQNDVLVSCKKWIWLSHILDEFIYIVQKTSIHGFTGSGMVNSPLELNLFCHNFETLLPSESKRTKEKRYIFLGTLHRFDTWFSSSLTNFHGKHGFKLSSRVIKKRSASTQKNIQEYTYKKCLVSWWLSYLENNIRFIS